MASKLSGQKRRQMGDAAGKEIRRRWGDMDVVDAKSDLRVFITPEDVAGATRKDPAYCVFARACRRTFHAAKVLFFRGVAYVELPDSSGRKKVERFRMGEKMRDLIAAFDRGETVIPEAGFLLRAPSRSKSLESERRRATDKRERIQRSDRKVIRGSGIGQGKGKYRDDPIFVDIDVRSGIGAVHFTCKDAP
jgi:hypothetical protein